MSHYDDPFQEARAKCPIHVGTFKGEKVPMILRLKDVREAAKDTLKYSSDAPRRVPIPPEEDVRTVRQYPLEVDPPVHEEYRRIVEPNEVRLDRRPNPHVAFGFRPHICLGAHHARAIMRGLIRALAGRVARIEILKSVELIEKEPDYTRKIGYELRQAKFTTSCISSNQ